MRSIKAIELLFLFCLLSSLYFMDLQVQQTDHDRIPPSS